MRRLLSLCICLGCAIACSGSGDTAPTTETPAMAPTESPDPTRIPAITPTVRDAEPVGTPATETPEQIPTEAAQPLITIQATALPHDLVAVTPDGRVVLLPKSDPGAVVELFVLPGEGWRRPTISLSTDGAAVYVSTRECTSVIWRVPLDGGPSEEVVIGSAASQSSDGRFLAYAAKHRLRTADSQTPGEDRCAHNSLVLRDLSDGTEREWLMNTNASITDVRLSPDGHSVALVAGWEIPAVTVFRPDRDTELYGAPVIADTASRDVVTPGWQDESAPASTQAPLWLTNETMLVTHACCYSTDIGAGVLLVDLVAGTTTPDDPFGEIYALDIADEILLGFSSGNLTWTTAVGAENAIAQAGTFQDAVWAIDSR